MNGITAEKLEEAVAAGLTVALAGVPVRKMHEDAALPGQVVVVSARETGVAYDVKHAGKFGTQCELELKARVRSDSAEETAASVELLAKRLQDAFEGLGAAFFSAFVICLADQDAGDREINNGVREITHRYRVRCLLA